MSNVIPMIKDMPLSVGKLFEKLLTDVEVCAADVCVVITADRKQRGFSSIKIRVAGTNDNTEPYLLTDLAHSIIEKEIL